MIAKYQRSFSMREMGRKTLAHACAETKLKLHCAETSLLQNQAQCMVDTESHDVLNDPATPRPQHSSLTPVRHFRSLTSHRAYHTPAALCGGRWFFCVQGSLYIL